MSSFKYERESGDSNGHVPRSRLSACPAARRLTGPPGRSAPRFGPSGASAAKRSNRSQLGSSGWTPSTSARSNAVGTPPRSRPRSGSPMRSTSTSPSSSKVFSRVCQCATRRRRIVTSWLARAGAPAGGDCELTSDLRTRVVPTSRTRKLRCSSRMVAPCGERPITRGTSLVADPPADGFGADLPPQEATSNDVSTARMTPSSAVTDGLPLTIEIRDRR
jgi:hypothetical protein